MWWEPLPEWGPLDSDFGDLSPPPLMVGGKGLGDYLIGIIALTTAVRNSIFGNWKITSTFFKCKTT